MPPYEPPKDELVSNFENPIIDFSGGVGYGVNPRPEALSPFWRKAFSVKKD